MAIYWNTIRSETKVIDGIEIGRYSYAYKESWSYNNYPGGRGQRVRAAESRAEDALHKNRNVRHFVFADSFADATEDGYSVWRINREPSLSISTIPNDAVMVGYLRKEGRRFVFRRYEEKAAA